MPDRLFDEEKLAALYDYFCPWDARDDFSFYFPMVMAAKSVLDVGCGTGMLLHRARENGHTGRLCGLDPAHGMLERARTRSGIEWAHGDLGSVTWDQEFDLVLMTGHAFQVLLSDEEVRSALSSIRSALVRDGRFAFETRNPLAREWERWTPENAQEVVDSSGNRARLETEVDYPVNSELVSFNHTFRCEGWQRPETSRSVLRFLTAESLSEFLADADLVVEEQYGDWDRSPLTDESPEIVTIAACRE